MCVCVCAPVTSKSELIGITLVRDFFRETLRHANVHSVKATEERQRETGRLGGVGPGVAQPPVVT